MMGLLMGFAFGIAAILFLEFLDKSFLDVQEAAAFLNTPLLGAISKISTEESIKEENESYTNLLFWLMVAGVLMISLTIMYVNIRAY